MAAKTYLLLSNPPEKPIWGTNEAYCLYLAQVREWRIRVLEWRRPRAMLIRALTNAYLRFLESLLGDLTPRN